MAGYAFETQVGCNFVISAFIFDVVALYVLVLAAAPEVHHEYLVLLLLQPHQKVLRLDVVVDKTLGVHPLDTLEHLVCDEEGGLEGEGAPAEGEELLQGGPVYVADEDAVVMFDAVPVEVGNALAALDGAVELGLPFQHAVGVVDRLDLNCQLLLRIQLETQVDLRAVADADAGGRCVLLVKGKL